MRVILLTIIIIESFRSGRETDREFVVVMSLRSPTNNKVVMLSSDDLSTWLRNFY